MSWQYFWLLCEKIACTVYEHEQVQNVGEFHVELLKKLLVYLAVKFVLYPNLLRIDVHSNQPSCPRIEMLWTAVLIPFAIVGMFYLNTYLVRTSLEYSFISFIIMRQAQKIIFIIFQHVLISDVFVVDSTSQALSRQLSCCTKQQKQSSLVFLVKCKFSYVLL